ncbi:MAG TPA: twin-arginine translocase subunit TatC [Chloroflexia bacterium]|nr:twin-arginine translocase subunit TatC [Chloroflexia bacterium]
MALVEHVRELRDRLIRTVLGVAATTALSFFFIDRLVGLFLNLLPQGPNISVQVLQPAETFTAYFKVALTFGIVLAMPLIVYQLFRFIAPGLSGGERRWLLLSLPMITIFFLVGVVFCYTLVLPSALGFLLNFGDVRIARNIRLSDFIGFVTTFMLAVGITFELPPVMFLLAKLGVVSPVRMRAVRRYVVVVAFIVAAIITPTPDPINQAIVAIPIYLLYELGLLFARAA